MGLRGSPPTPTAVLEFRGTGKNLKYTRAGEPRPPVERPPCPKWLSEEGKLEWNRQTRNLIQMGCIAKCDGAALAIYCEAWAEYERASKRILLEGLLIDSGDGVVPHPLLSARDKAADKVLRVAQQFGFTPSARARLIATPQAKEDGKSTLYKIRE